MFILSFSFSFTLHIFLGYCAPSSPSAAAITLVWPSSPNPAAPSSLSPSAAMRSAAASPSWSIQYYIQADVSGCEGKVRKQSGISMWGRWSRKRKQEEKERKNNSEKGDEPGAKEKKRTSEKKRRREKKMLCEFQNDDMFLQKRKIVGFFMQKGQT